MAIWLMLVVLTLMSLILAERLRWHEAAIIAMFGIAGVKGELVVAHYMEIGRALPRWRIAYRVWLVTVAVVLTVAHLIG